MIGCGAQAIVAGCTELGLILRPEDLPKTPLIDTVQVHCRELLEFSLGPEKRG